MRAINVVALASLNKGKLAEFQELFAKHNIKVAPLDEFVRNASFLGEVESRLDDASYSENALKKCMAAFHAAKVPTLADDSGLEIEALKGQPGVHSAHYGAVKANLSQNQANRKKVLDELKGKSNRSARMRAVLAFMVEGVELLAEGICEGKIAEREIGEGGFGYDSIFIPEGGDGRTFAQMSTSEKADLSHRALAVAKLVEQLQERDIQLVRP
jgi:XTP/dITP diphosphohydrolase